MSTHFDISRYEGTLMNAINLANLYNYYDTSGNPYLFDYMLHNDIDYSIIDLYCNVLERILVELQNKDYDLQYLEGQVSEDGKIIPGRKQDTFITFDLLKVVEMYQESDLANMTQRAREEVLYTMNQIAVNGLKFQLKYALSTIKRLLKDESIWGEMI